MIVKTFCVCDKCGLMADFHYEAEHNKRCNGKFVEKEFVTLDSLKKELEKLIVDYEKLADKVNNQSFPKFPKIDAYVIRGYINGLKKAISLFGETTTKEEVKK